MNLLIDTNIIIDYLGRKPPFFSTAEKVIAAGYFGDAKIWASASSMKDAYYVLSKYVDQAKVQRAIKNFCEIVSLISLTESDVLRAVQLEWEDMEDCLIALSAEKAKADFLITRDSKGFERSSVPAISPDDWLALMHEEHGLEYDAEELG